MAVKAHGSSLLALGLAAVAASGCEAYDASLVPPGDSGMGPDPGCVDGSRVIPPRPDAPDDGISVPTVVFALKEPLLGQGDTANEIGVNLDRVCTNVPSLQSRCRPPGIAFLPPTDGPQGVDNAFGTELFPIISTIDPTLQPTSTDSSERGLGVVMVELIGWNGTDDDSRVNVVVSQSVVGTAPNLDGTCPGLGTDFVIDVTDNYRAKYPSTHPTMADDYYPLPAWNQDNPDCFWVREENFATGDRSRPNIKDDNAYIAGRTIVANLGDNNPIIFSSSLNGVIVRLTNMAAFGPISADGRRIEPVTVVGAWPLVSLYQTAEALNICPTSAVFPLLQSIVDQYADVRSEPTEGAVGSDLECDALSVGVTFQGYLGKLVGLTPGPPVPDLCP